MPLHKKPSKINPDEVDPSVYYYDEVYDDMKNDECNEEGQKPGSSSKDNRPKYTQGLVESANLRKTEKELRKFKKYARDREEARADTDDKDIYMTASYEKKLVEMKKLEEEHQSRIKSEKDRTLNFARKLDDMKPKTDLESKLKRQSEVEPEDRQVIDKREDEGFVPPDIDTMKQELSEKLPERQRPPITLDERRKYLKGVLAKRTVGERYEEAVRRYIERKAKAQAASS